MYVTSGIFGEKLHYRSSHRPEIPLISSERPFVLKKRVFRMLWGSLIPYSMHLYGIQRCVTAVQGGRLLICLEGVGFMRRDSSMYKPCIA